MCPSSGANPIRPIHRRSYFPQVDQLPHLHRLRLVATVGPTTRMASGLSRKRCMLSPQNPHLRATPLRNNPCRLRSRTRIANCIFVCCGIPILRPPFTRLIPQQSRNMLRIQRMTNPSAICRPQMIEVQFNPAIHPEYLPVHSSISRHNHRLALPHAKLRRCQITIVHRYMKARHKALQQLLLQHIGQGIAIRVSAQSTQQLQL